MAIILPPNQDSEEPSSRASEAEAAFRNLDNKLLSFSPSHATSEEFQGYWENLLKAAHDLESERLSQGGVPENSVEKYLSRGWAVFENQKVNGAGTIAPTSFSKEEPHGWIPSIPVVLLQCDGIWRLAPCLEIALLHHPSLRALGDAQEWSPGKAFDEARRIINDARKHLPPSGLDHNSSIEGPAYNIEIGLLADQLAKQISPKAWESSSEQAEPFWSIVRDALQLGKLMGEHRILTDPDFVKFARRAVALQSGSKSRNDPWLNAIREAQSSLPKPLTAAKLLKHFGGEEDYQTQKLSFPAGTPMYGLPPINRSQFDNKVRGQRTGKQG